MLTSSPPTSAPGTDKTGSGFPAHFAGNSLPVLSVPGFGAHSPRWFFAPGFPGALPEELRHEVGEVVPPVAPDVALFGWCEGVLDVVFGHQVVERLGACEEAVRFAAGNVEEFQFFIGGGGIGQQVLVLGLQSLGAPATAGAESPHGVEDVQMVQAHAEGLSAAHGEAGDGADRPSAWA